MSDQNFPLTLAEVLYEELHKQNSTAAAKFDPEIRRLRDKRTWLQRKVICRRIVPLIYDEIRGLAKTDPNATRSALCLSGGGIRSAIFNLGVLQGLASCGLLKRFDYLSTVSGGGYIASWLTRWIYREGADKVIAELKKRPESPLEPEPKPVYNLRVFSNFLTPRTGALSPDTWTMIATYLRNLFLNWLVFIPAIMTFLMLPRIWTSLVNNLVDRPGRYLPLTLGALGLSFGLISLWGIVKNLPSAGNKNWTERRVLLSCVVPLVLMAGCLSLYWVMVRRHYEPVTGWGSSLLAVFHGNKPSWHVFVLAGAVVPGLPQLGLSLSNVADQWKKEGLAGIWELLVVTGLVTAGGALTGALTYVLANISPGQYDTRLLYAALSVPFLLCIFMVGGTFVAGFSSRFTGSEDQEWWARCGAWMLMVVLGWGVLTLLVTYGPPLLLGLLQINTLLPLSKKVHSVIAAVSGLIAVFGGKSSKTKGNGKEQDSDPKAKVFAMIISIAAGIFALYIAILLVFATDWILFGLAQTLNTARGLIDQIGVHFRALPSAPGDHRMSVTGYPWWLEVFATGVLLLLTWLMGWCINTNRFSLHYWWRNRMMRSMLGTTREDREREASRTKFTDFDNEDNVPMNKLNFRQHKEGVPMHELRDQRPFHILNVTLNLVGGDKLEWQDRKAESFTISPVHCGSYWLGYRKSQEYGGPYGISLATAASISGAAASPNMGYMMTSSIVRIIMTLFNVRLGFWLGNPGPAGEKTYKLDSPEQSVQPIVEEALGLTDDKKPYVYLSDGGHFENLGLYEMILRRCRFIVVCDATTDTDYEYEALAMAIRQIRVDFGVPIDMGTMKFDREPTAENNYCALGLIRYSCVDKSPESTTPDEEYDGVLIYLKPSLLGDEPRDVLNYHSTSPTFPQESAADQWFSEAQFESYRMLGRHMIERICKSPTLTGKGKPDHVLLGGAKISSGGKASDERVSIEGWLEKLSTAKVPDSVAHELQAGIEAVIAKLHLPDGAELDPDCDFERFAANANEHVNRHKL